MTESGDPGTTPSPLPAALRRCLRPSLVFFLVALAAGLVVGEYVAPTWTVEKINLDVAEDDDGKLFYTFKDDRAYIDDLVPIGASELSEVRIAGLNAEGGSPKLTEQYVWETREVGGKSTKLYFKLEAKCHWGFWSLLPAAAAVGLCWMTREPLISLFGGIVVGAFLLGRYDITDAVFVKNFATVDAAGVLLLYLWLLGGLLGVWSRTGAAQAFADLMTRKFVRGPKTAKLVAWALGIIFFQGGTVSTVL
ncbi:MAG: sodium:proton antiporter, partial [Planctomycetota bacterium]